MRVAPVPGKRESIGIEVPNRETGVVTLREVMEADAFVQAQAKETVAVGKGIGGEAVVCEISKLPHLLLGGSACPDITMFMHAAILSLLRKASPGNVKLILTDLRKCGMDPYNGVSHLLIPVVTEPERAVACLKWAVEEMMCRYGVMTDADVCNIDAYNAVMEAKQADRMPRIVIILDELADVMRVGSNEAEEAICRIAQMGCAAGIHLIVATQRPCVDVISGLIKANFPSRMAFVVSSAMESRMLLDIGGAEKLIGCGDMLFAPIDVVKPLRVQGCFVPESEVEIVTNYIKNAYGICNDSAAHEVIERIEAQIKSRKTTASGSDNTNTEPHGDEMLLKAVDVVLETGMASVSMLQRRLKLGYARATCIMDEMEEKGIVGPFEGSKPRVILITKEQWAKMRQAMTRAD